jgi:hypothetical protein
MRLQHSMSSLNVIFCVSDSNRRRRLYGNPDNQSTETPSLIATLVIPSRSRVAQSATLGRLHMDTTSSRAVQLRTTDSIECPHVGCMRRLQQSGNLENGSGSIGIPRRLC